MALCTIPKDESDESPLANVYHTIQAYSQNVAALIPLSDIAEGLLNPGEDASIKTQPGTLYVFSANSYDNASKVITAICSETGTPVGVTV